VNFPKWKSYTYIEPSVTVIQALHTILVRSSRTGNGRVIGRKEYDDLGYIPADTLNPQKSRILLMLALTRTNDLNEIRRMFSEY
jgi:L-asparaginase